MPTTHEHLRLEMEAFRRQVTDVILYPTSREAEVGLLADALQTTGSSRHTIAAGSDRRIERRIEAPGAQPRCSRQIDVVDQELLLTVGDISETVHPGQ